MVLKNILRKYRLPAIILLIAFFFSCEETPLSFGFCSTCQSEEPQEAILEIKLKWTYSPFSTIIKIYEGNLEDSVLFATWTTTEIRATRKVPLNKTYTVTATNSVNGSIYVAVNSVLPRARYDETTCETPCYYIIDNTVNLRLKYTR